jgi:hypothetical protein
MHRYMNRVMGLVALVALAGSLNFGFAAGKQQTLSGVIGDSMCGTKHMNGVSAAQCTRTCVGQGSKYALVVGDKVYTLKGGDSAALDKLAGEKATVKGTVDGDVIQVASVSPAK